MAWSLVKRWLAFLTSLGTHLGYGVSSTRWDPDGVKFFEQVGHTLEVTFDADTFLAAAKNGDYDVLMLMVDIEEARELKDEMESLAPDAAVLPILKFPTRSVYSAARMRE